MLNFGYTRTENRILTGYAFYDVNNNGSYDIGWDDPYAGAEITVTTLSRDADLPARPPLPTARLPCCPSPAANTGW